MEYTTSTQESGYQLHVPKIKHTYTSRNEMLSSKTDTSSVNLKDIAAKLKPLLNRKVTRINELTLSNDSLFNDDDHTPNLK